MKPLFSVPNASTSPLTVMAGLVPAIHAFFYADREVSVNVDGRDKPGHDDLKFSLVLYSSTNKFAQQHSREEVRKQFENSYSFRVER
jgi:hypothetical protein